MKRTLALFLAVLMTVSFCCVGVYSADTVTVTFYDEDGSTVLSTVSVDPATGLTEAPTSPSSTHDGVYFKVFAGWTSDGETTVDPTSVTYTEDTTYTAVYTTYGEVYENPVAEKLPQITEENPASLLEISTGSIPLASGYSGMTLVYKVEGAESDIITDHFYFMYRNTSGGLSSPAWQWCVADLSSDGLAPYSLTLKNGYHYMYINTNIMDNGNKKVVSLEKLVFFGTHMANNYHTSHTAASGYIEATRENVNDNENATFTLLAVVQDNLQPTVTFMNGDNTTVLGTYKCSYTSETSAHSNYKNPKSYQEGSLLTIDEAYASLGLETPAKEGYEFSGWVDEKGNPVEYLYYNVDVYPSFTKAPTGTVTPAYTKEVDGYVRVWGEGGGNASESYVLKLYSGDTLIATTSLNNVGGIIDGDVYVTWNFFYPESSDEYWTTTWEEGHPNSAAQPTKVVLYIDGVAVAENVAKMSGADDLNPVVWEELGGVEYIVTGLTGAGTADDPYLINNIDELKWFRDDVNAGNTYAGMVVKLTADIDLNNEQWTAIGTSSNMFKGTFDGGNYTISNLKCVLDPETTQRAALFGEINGATVKNLTVNNVEATALARVSAIVGGATNATIDNCHVTGDIKLCGYQYVGAIVGKGYVTVTNCSVAGTADNYADYTVPEGSSYGKMYMGGIAGWLGEGNCTVSGCSVKYVNMTTDANVGAVTGLAHYGNTVSNCTVEYVNITANSANYREGTVGLIAGGCGGTEADPTTITGNTVSDVAATDGGETVTALYGTGPMGDGTVAVTNYVAEVDGVLYESLQAAIDAAGEGATVTLLRNVTITESIVVAADDEITLDLNGKTLQTDATVNDETSVHTVINNGTLTVTDSVGGGAVVANDCYTAEDGTKTKNGYAINSTGTLVIDGAKIEGTNWGYAVVVSGKTTIEEGSVINGRGAVYAASGAELTINGGEFAITVETTNARDHVICLAGGDAVINGGTFDGSAKEKWPDDAASTHAGKGSSAVMLMSSESSVVINGGTFVASEADIYGYSSGTTATVNDGTFSTGLLTRTGAEIDLYGGTYTYDPADYCADGFVPEQNDDGTYGIIDDPSTHYISDLDELKAFRDDVNAGNTYANVTVYLAADIDLGGEEWTPIGNSTNKFQGAFDGQGHTISNLVINAEGENNIGFFGYTVNGEVKNLTISNAKVSGRLNVGVVAGTPYTTKYTNITVTGHVEVNGMAYVGGVGGKNAYADWTDITVNVDETSYVKATSTENGTAYRTYVGGVIGFMGEGGHTFKNITSNIDVIGDVCDVGGITGIIHYGNNFINITCSGDVTNTNSDAENVLETGGIAGTWMNNNSGVTIDGLTYTGTVSAPNAGEVEFSNGGLIGAAYSASGSAEIGGDVAAVNGKTYATLAEAATAAQAGDTIILLADVTDAGTISLKAGVTLDGNGKTISGNSCVYMAKDGTTVIENVNFEDIHNEAGKLSAIYATGLTSDANVTISGCTFRNIDWDSMQITSVNDAVPTITITGNTFLADDDDAVVQLRHIHIEMGTSTRSGSVLTITENKFYGDTFALGAWYLDPANTTDNIGKNYFENPANVSITFNTEAAGSYNADELALPFYDEALENEIVYEAMVVVDKYTSYMYATLAEAIAAAAEGETVKLLADVTLDTMVTVTGKVTLDLNGKTVKTNFTAASGNDMAICVAYGADLTVTDSVGGGVIDGSGVYGAIKMTNTGDNAENGTAKLTVDGGTLIGYYYAIVGNGSRHGTEIVINGGTVTATNNPWGYGIFHPQDGTVTVNSGTIEAATGIEMRAGTLVVNGGTIKSTASELATSTSDSGSTVSGAAIAISQHNTNKAINVTVNGGTLSGIYAVYQNRLTKTYSPSTDITASIAAGVVAEGSKVDALEAGFDFTNTDGAYDLVEVACVAQIGETKYETLAEAFAAVKEGETIELLAGTISEGTVKMPATLKNVTLKGAEGAVIKDTTITAADGNSLVYEGLTFDGVAFENSNIVITGWRSGEVTIKDLTITNCEFKNFVSTSNMAAVHINLSASAGEAVNGFTFTNNVIDGVTGSNNSGFWLAATGKVVISDNVINNVGFRPYQVQVVNNDGVADELTVTGNTFSGSAVGRAQAYGADDEGTDNVTLTVTGNIFKDITNAQQICYWNFNPETTTADLSKNYYDIDIVANPNKIYYNSAAQDISDLIEMGVYPYYADEAMTTLVYAPAIEVTYADGTVAYFNDILDAVPFKTNYDILEGATIKLLADYTGSGIRMMENDMVLDLNGFTYTIDEGTGSSGTRTSGIQVRPEVTTNVTIKNGTLAIAAPEAMDETYGSIAYMINNYAANLVMENVVIDMTNMTWSYGTSVYAIVSRTEDNVVLTGTTSIINFDEEVGGASIYNAGTMTIDTTGTLEGQIVLDDAASTVTAPEGLTVTTTVENSVVVYAAGVYSVLSNDTLWGDVNGDGNIDGTDAMLLNRYTSGWAESDYSDAAELLACGDINADGIVNGIDAMLLNRYASGWAESDYADAVNLLAALATLD